APEPLAQPLGQDVLQALRHVAHAVLRRDHALALLRRFAAGGLGARAAVLLSALARLVSAAAPGRAVKSLAEERAEERAAGREREFGEGRGDAEVCGPHAVDALHERRQEVLDRAS